MARATGKTSKHKRQRPGSLARVKRTRRKHAKVVKRLRWETEGNFTDPVIYAYDSIAGQLSPVGKVTWLPELVGLLVKAIHYFEIDGHPDGPKRSPPSRATLKTFFTHQQLSDGSRLSPRLVDVMATLCLPLQLMKGGRPRKGPSSPLEDLHAGSSARERERVLLRLISGDDQGSLPSDEEAEKH